MTGGEPVPAGRKNVGCARQTNTQGKAVRAPNRLAGMPDNRPPPGVSQPREQAAITFKKLFNSFLNRR
jgi:hypothetical protein